MSKIKLRLFGSLLLLGFAVMSGAPASADDCIDVVMYAVNPANGQCSRVNPCAIPQGWIVVPNCDEQG